MQKSYFDVFDEHDDPQSRVASYEEVHGQGLWHRGVHVIIYTPEKEIVMQKRSPSLAYHPDEIEVSVGGGVDAGETPEQAIVREIHEELGLTVRADQLRFLGKTKFNHHTKTQISRCFIYGYALCLPKSQLQMTRNPEETSALFLISKRRLRRALRLHRIKNFGKISDRNSYWNFLLDAI